MNNVSVQNKKVDVHLLPPEVFVDALSFLQPQDLACSARVCRSWNRCVESEVQWKIQCQNLLDLSEKTDPRNYVPDSSSYKVIFRALFEKAILGPHEYERYVGKVGSVPRIPKGLSLQRLDQPDPCDPSQTIGKNYIWMYIPSHIEIDSEGVALSKLDDLNDEEAPILLRRGEDLEESVPRAIETGSVLKVPVTINNLKVLFEHPKTGNPSTYRDDTPNHLLEVCGNKRPSAGWVCMRKDVIFRQRWFADQQALVSASGVVLSELLPRILFNFLGHIRSGIYPDGQTPWTYARTSTLYRYPNHSRDWPLGCGDGTSSGLHILCESSNLEVVGVAVVLPAEVQAIGP